MASWFELAGSDWRRETFLHFNRSEIIQGLRESVKNAGKPIVFYFAFSRSENLGDAMCDEPVKRTTEDNSAAHANIPLANYSGRDSYAWNLIALATLVKIQKFVRIGLKVDAPARRRRVVF